MKGIFKIEHKRCEFLVSKQNCEVDECAFILQYIYVHNIMNVSFCHKNCILNCIKCQCEKL